MIAFFYRGNYALSSASMPRPSAAPLGEVSAARAVETAALGPSPTTDEARFAKNALDGERRAQQFRTDR